MIGRFLRISAAGMLLVALTWTAGTAPAVAQRGFGDQPGVTLYSDGDFRGSSETFVGDIADLRRSRIGSDRASSVRVDRGCRAILYSDANFRGRSMEVTFDVPALSGSQVGNDSVSSLRVDCGPGQGQGPPLARQAPAAGPDHSGVTIFWRDDFHGRSHFFHQDHPNLGQTPFGHDQASSIILDSGCRVTLYSEPNYRGQSVTLTSNERHLGQTSVGDNTVSSLQVSCR